MSTVMLNNVITSTIYENQAPQMLGNNDNGYTCVELNKI